MADHMTSDDKMKPYPSPSQNAGVFSKLFFMWMNALVRLAYKRELQDDDMYDVIPSEKSELFMHQVDRLRAEGRQQARKFRLMRCMLRVFWVRLLGSAILHLTGGGMKILLPYSLSMIVSYILRTGDVSVEQAWGWLSLLTVASIFQIFTSAFAFYGENQVGMSARAMVSTLIYQKVLRIGSEAFTTTSTGHIVNLMSTDVEKFIYCFGVFSPICGNLIASGIMFYLMYRDLGWPALAGAAVMAFIIVINLLVVSKCGHLRKVTAKWTDKRAQLMSEVISGMKIVKMHCWEKAFHEKTSTLRREEMSVIRMSTQLWTQSQSLGVISLKLMTCTIFICHVLRTNVLDPIKIIRLVGWCEMMKVCSILFSYIPHTLQAAASIDRIQKFLELPECGLRKDVNENPMYNGYENPAMKQEVSHSPGFLCDTESCDMTESADGQTSCGMTPASSKLGNETSDDDSSACDKICQPTVKSREDWDSNFTIKASSLTVGWPNIDTVKSETTEKYSSVLHDVECSIRQGELVALIGRVGSGKTSFLMALLGELSVCSGTVTLHGSTAYVSEESWIFSDTVRENILFGSEMSEDWYQKVIHACSLDEDIATFPYGDLSLVGERGLSLSGGQKARLNLARAIYKNSHIYLLDDPLSALDAKVAHETFHRCILGLLRDKTCLLVTHNLNYLHAVDNILIMEKGCITAHRTYSDLKGNPNFKSILSKNQTFELEVDTIQIKDAFETSESDSTVCKTTRRQHEVMEHVAEEDKGEGTISRSSYWNYFKSGGIVSVLLYVIMLIFAQIGYIAMDWWIIEWSEARPSTIQNSTLHNTTTSTLSLDDNTRLYIFIGITAGFVLTSILRGLILASFTSTASQVLHDAMYIKVLQAPSVFFEQNPVGRVLNRFARDVGMMDSEIPQIMHDSSLMLIAVVGVLIMVCIVNPWLTLVSLPALTAFALLRQYTISTVRGLRRIEATCRSPIFSQVSATLQGLYTIRSFNMEKNLIKRFNNTQDRHTSVWFLFISAIRWLGMRVDLVVLLLQTVVLVIVMLLPVNEIDSVLLSVSLVHILGMFDIQQYAIQQTTLLENLFTSVERIQDYVKLDQEAPEHTSLVPESSWPHEGSIQFVDVRLHYKDLKQPALKGVTFTITDKEKIGVVGRTGAGKSSVFTSLLRLVEPEGRIIIDGINICEIGLTDLRRCISVIPQDPVLFTGTLRYNLDPFEEFDDVSKWEALEKVQLGDKISSLESGLDFELTEGGSNFSVGERQLICLARAILECNKILLIDEATAYVDHRTDETIQKAIREQFVDCTVITIAHRLNTVIDADRILVLMNGIVCEFDHPYVLLQKKGGVLHQMASYAGDHHLEMLKKLAEQSNIDQEHL